MPTLPPVNGQAGAPPAHPPPRGRLPSVPIHQFHTPPFSRCLPPRSHDMELRRPSRCPEIRRYPSPFAHTFRPEEARGGPMECSSEPKPHNGRDVRGFQHTDTPTPTLHTSYTSRSTLDFPGGGARDEARTHSPRENGVFRGRPIYLLRLSVCERFRVLPGRSLSCSFGGGGQPRFPLLSPSPRMVHPPDLHSFPR